MPPLVHVVGGGLAGCEAAWQLAERGVDVVLHEMRPARMTAAHASGRLAELVCSNTFKSTELTNAHGLLKAELRVLGSLILQAADCARVPAGTALAVDRTRFSEVVTERIRAHSRIRVDVGEVSDLPSPGIIATGPLTSDALAAAIRARLGVESLAFYDAIAPIVDVDSIDHTVAFRASRYGKETAPLLSPLAPLSSSREEREELFFSQGTSPLVSKQRRERPAAHVGAPSLRSSGAKHASGTDPATLGHDPQDAVPIPEPEGAASLRPASLRPASLQPAALRPAFPPAGPEVPPADGDGGAYLNCPLTRDEYDAFIDALISADQHQGHAFDEAPYFEGCLPVEEMAARGRDSLRFGPMKPVGLIDPKTGRRAHAVVQLRAEDRAGRMWNLVGFQTRLRIAEQQRVFRMIPGLANAEFLRYGSIHRNSYVNAPAALTAHLSLRDDPMVLLAGQITGVEGYTESAATGLVAGINFVRMLIGEPPSTPPSTTMLGALYRYLREADPKHFQPMNANFGLVDELPVAIRDKQRKREMIAERAMQEIEAWARA